jgi:hypothetical protein
MKLQRVEYGQLNSRAQEMYNFHKVASALADYGFTCMWLNNDWQGADFIAVHVDGVTDIKVQLKSRLSFAKKYIGKSIYVCFIEAGSVYLYPHDEVLNKVEAKISDKTWQAKGTWSTPSITAENKKLLAQYKL